MWPRRCSSAAKLLPPPPRRPRRPRRRSRTRSSSGTTHDAARGRAVEAPPGAAGKHAAALQPKKAARLSDGAHDDRGRAPHDVRVRQERVVLQLTVLGLGRIKFGRRTETRGFASARTPLRRRGIWQQDSTRPHRSVATGRSRSRAHHDTCASASPPSAAVIATTTRKDPGPGAATRRQIPSSGRPGLLLRLAPGLLMRRGRLVPYPLS